MTNAEIQTALNAAGYGPLSTDGVIGPKSLEAIKRFQSQNSLMADGIVGPRTAAMLSSRLAANTPVAIDGDVATGVNVFSDKGMAMLGRSEGIKTHAYYDTKHIVTIGMGATWASEIFREWWIAHHPNEPFTIHSTMSLDDINTVTRAMIDHEYGAAVNKALDGKVVPQHCYDAAVHAIYNMGTGAVKWKWFSAFADGDYKTAAEMLEHNYNKPLVLAGRRKKESALMSSGVYA